MNERPEKIRVQIRWLVRRDMPQVLDIEDKSFEFPWRKEDFVRCLRAARNIGVVAECGDRLVGFVLYQLHKSRIEVLNFAVAADCRRRGVGSQMLAWLIAKLCSQRRSRILVEVRETNLRGQLFFHQNGFRAVSVLRAPYDDSQEDGYGMEYRYRPEKPALTPPVNRIAKLLG